MIFDLQVLREVPMFKGLVDSDLQALGERLTERRFHAGEILVNKGEAGTSMFVILSGEVRIFLPAEAGDEPTVLKDLGPGGFFGEMSLLDNLPRAASVMAISATVLGELTRENFVAQLQGSTHAVMAMLSEMSQRLRNTTRLLEAPIARDVNRESDETLTVSQRLADRVARWNGSWGFIVLLTLLSAAWFELNAIGRLAFDPYPYQFFNLFLAILVAVQGPLIMMSQNRQSAKERLHSEADYQVNLKNELGIDRILRELAHLRSELHQFRAEVRS